MVDEPSPAPPAEEAPEPNFKCKKCGKPYERGGKFLVRHEEACDGTPWTPDQKRTRAYKRPKDAAPAKPIPPGPFDKLLKQANQNREEIQKDIDHHKEKLKVLGRHIERLTLHAGKLDQIIADMKKAQTD